VLLYGIRELLSVSMAKIELMALVEGAIFLKMVLSEIHSGVYLYSRSRLLGPVRLGGRTSTTPTEQWTNAAGPLMPLIQWSRC